MNRLTLPTVLLLGCSILVSPSCGQHDRDHQTYKGREIAEVMSYLGANWLLRANRVEQEQPKKMLDALKIEEGQTIADVGAGVGYHSLMISKRVGPNGTVYATDVQPEMLAMLKERAEKAGARNIKPVLVTQENPGLPEGKIDLILMVDVYHEISDPDAALRGFFSALKPGGRLVLVEYREETYWIKPDHRLGVEQARKEVEPEGFTFDESLEFLPWQHIMIFEKPEGEASKSPQDDPS